MQHKERSWLIKLGCEYSVNMRTSNKQCSGLHGQPTLHIPLTWECCVMPFSWEYPYTPLNKYKNLFSEVGALSTAQLATNNLFCFDFLTYFGTSLAYKKDARRR